MLQQQQFSTTLPPGIEIDPEEWLVSQGKLQPRNPDNTSPADRVALVQKFFRESDNSRIRQESVRYWQEADRLCKGFHWGDLMSGSPEYRVEFQFVINLLYSIKEKLVSMLVEGIPELEFLERNPNETQIATQIDNFFRHEWERNNWMAALVIALDEAIKHKTGWLKVFWDPREDGGRGAVRIEPVSNYDLFLHESAMIRDGKLESKYVIHRMDKTRNEIIAQWKVDPSGEFQQHVGQQTGQRPTRSFLDTVREEANAMRGMSASDSRPPRYPEKKETFQVYECHYQDDSLVKSTGIDNSAPAMLEYPAGRVLIECNGHLLFDGHNPAGFQMFVPFTTDPSVDSIYGPSIINQLAGMQMALNKCISQMIEHTERCSNPVLKISSLSKSLNSDSDIGAPGSRIVTMDGDAGASYMEVPALGFEVKDVLTLMVEFMEMVSGVHEVTQGETSAQARSGIAIERLQAAAATRSNLRSINFDQGMKTLARNICSLFLDFENNDRQYRFLDEDAMEETYGVFNAQTLVLPSRERKIEAIEQHIMQLRQDFMAIARYRSPQDAEMLKEYYISMMEDAQREIYQTYALPAHDLVSFDVRIQTGSRSMTQAQRESRAFMLFELDTITEASLFKMLQVPNAHKLLQMKAQERQMMAEAQSKSAREQLALENQNTQVEHEGDMELAELKGLFDVVVAKIQAKVAEKQAEERAKKAAA